MGSLGEVGGLGERRARAPAGGLEKRKTDVAPSPGLGGLSWGGARAWASRLRCSRIGWSMWAISVEEPSAAFPAPAASVMHAKVMKEISKFTTTVAEKVTVPDAPAGSKRNCQRLAFRGLLCVSPEPHTGRAQPGRLSWGEEDGTQSWLGDLARPARSHQGDVRFCIPRTVAPSRNRDRPDGSARLVRRRDKEPVSLRGLARPVCANKPDRYLLARTALVARRDVEGEPHTLHRTVNICETVADDQLGRRKARTEI